MCDGHQQLSRRDPQGFYQLEIVLAIILGGLFVVFVIVAKTRFLSDVSFWACLLIALIVSILC
jgi:hypothetical protein